MEFKTTTLEGKLYDIISEDDYRVKAKAYAENPSMVSAIAMEVKGNDGKDYILPFRGKTDDRPGVYVDGAVFFTKTPKDEEGKQTYGIDNLQIIDYSNTENVKDFLEKNNQIREMEAIILTDIDSVFVPPLNQDDTPEMRAFKEAVSSKHMDINKYSPRFGDNFLNDKRILKTSSITMNKLVSMCKKLDIEAELTLRNSNPDVANPMDKEITVILTGSEEE